MKRILSSVRKILTTPEKATKALFDLAWNRDMKSAKNLAQEIHNLVDLGANINAHNASGNTPLLVAVNFSDAEAAKALITEGADVNRPDNYGYTPLYIASREGRVEAINALIAGNADVNRPDNYGYTPLHEASRQGKVEAINALIAGNADVNRPNNYGDTPLHEATLLGHTEAIKTMIAAGARPNSLSNLGITPLERVDINRFPEAAQALIINGAGVGNLPAASLNTAPVQLAIQTRQFVDSVMNGTPKPQLNTSISDMLAYLVNPAEIAAVEREREAFQKQAQTHIAGILYVIKKMNHPMPAHILEEGLATAERIRNPALEKIKLFFKQYPEYSPDNFLTTILKPDIIEDMFNHARQANQLEVGLLNLLEIYRDNIEFAPAGITLTQLAQLADRISDISTQKQIENQANIEKPHRKYIESHLSAIPNGLSTEAIDKLLQLPSEKLSALNDLFSWIPYQDRLSTMTDNLDKVIKTASTLTPSDIREFARCAIQSNPSASKTKTLELFNSKNPIDFVFTLTKKGVLPKKESRVKTLRRGGSTSLGL